VGVVVRPPTKNDAEGLAQAARDLAEQYGKFEPDRFQMPDRATLVEWLEEVLGRPLPDDSLWLVAELDGVAVADAQAQLTSRWRTQRLSRAWTPVAVGCISTTWRSRLGTEVAASAVSCSRQSRTGHGRGAPSCC
jgi:hypothetical protein